MGDPSTKTSKNLSWRFPWLLHCQVPLILFRESTSSNSNHSHYYVHSGDCADRFYKTAAEGEVVRRLRLKPMCPDCRNGMDLTDVRYPAELERLAKIEKEKEAKKNRVNNLQQLDFRDYVIPSEELEDRGTLIRNGL